MVETQQKVANSCCDADSCVYFKRCNKEMWSQFKTKTKLFWIKKYCLGPDQNSCFRKKRRKKGLRVTNTYLPNNTYLDS